MYSDSFCFSPKLFTEDSKIVKYINLSKNMTFVPPQIVILPFVSSMNKKYKLTSLFKPYSYLNLLNFDI